LASECFCFVTKTSDFDLTGICCQKGPLACEDKRQRKAREIVR
jgi:hypothetical protein